MQPEAWETKMTPQCYHTRLTELLQIRHPILAGGLQWLSDATYVAAAVNAGGMGFITSRSFPDKDGFRAELRRCNELTGGRPFGVNFSLSSQPAHNSGVADAMRICAEEGVRIFETVAQGSSTALIEALHGLNGIVIHKSSSVKHAMSAERAGADVVGIVGHEEGGHPGDNDLSTFTLAMAAVRRIKKPIVVGGGIGTGEQILGMLGLGVDGVVMGSRLLVADENWAHVDFKHALVTVGTDCSTTVFNGNHALNGTWRVLKNETVAQIKERERAGKTKFEDFADLIGGSLTREHTYKNGNWQRGMISIGPAGGFSDRIEPMETIFDRLLAEAREAEARIARLTDRSGRVAAA
jgi:nitronate monooxygenase